MNQQKEAARTVPVSEAAYTREVRSDCTKRLATLKARAALNGITLHQLAAGGFLGTRWGLSRELADLEQVEAWLNITTGSRS